MCLNKVLVLGGDRRIVALANCFNEEGYDVLAYGFNTETEFEGGIIKAGNLKEALADINIVVMGLPSVDENMTLITPLCNDKIAFCDVLKSMKKGQMLFGGKISQKAKDMCKMYNIDVYDYLQREEFAVLNAVPSAEGAIEIAMRELPVTIHESKCLVLGFGRIGKILAKDLKALGANVYVEARKFKDLSWINAYGYNDIYLPNLKGYLPMFDVVFNTIPHEILTDEMLKHIRKDCPVIDLASLPGGVNDEKAKKEGVKVIHALSLPGKSSPKTSGEIIKRTVQNILSDMEV